MHTTSTAPIRKAIVRVTIGSFSLAALMGIVALLGGGDFGATQGRVLLTTLLVGVVSIAVLCYLVTAGRRSQPVGVAGGVVVLVPFVTALLMIWGDVAHGPSEGPLRTFGIGSVVAATLAQASLLLAMAERARTAVRRILVATLTLAAALAVMVSLLITGYNPSGDFFYRLLGVVAILDVLGTVVSAALMRFAGGAVGSRRSVDIAIPSELGARLADAAAATDRDQSQLVVEALERYLDQSTVRDESFVPQGTAQAD